MARKYFREKIRDFEEVERNMSLLICNYDPTLSFPLALAPNIVPAGGLHIEPVKPLSADLKKIVEDSQEGLVIFSFGQLF